MRIALWQPAAPFTGRQPFVTALAAVMARAAEAGCRLLLAPERPLRAPEGTPPADVAEPSDGALARSLAALCRRHRLGLAFGYQERFAGHVHASLMVLSPEGLALANYRRAHLRREEEGRIAAGNWLTLFPFAGWRPGLLGGADLEHPEPARALALTGADLLLAVGDGAGPEPAILRPLLAARARENRLPILYADFAPPRGAGSAAVAADGRALAGAGDDELLIAGPLAGEASDRRPKRRPELYARLTEIDG